jgi:thiol-disulfide isomerase/thioredoxin
MNSSFLFDIFGNQTLIHFAMRKTILLLSVFALVTLAKAQTSTSGKDTLANVLVEMKAKMDSHMKSLNERAKALGSNDEAGMNKLYKEYLLLVFEDKKQKIDLFLKNPESHSLFEVLPSYVNNFDKDEQKAIFNGLPDAYRNEAAGKQLYQQIFANDTALSISHPDAGGNILSLKSLRGKYVLVDFWASWCGPCMREVPMLRDAYAKFKDKGFEIYGISLDNDKLAWMNAVTANQMNWIQTSDLKGWKNEIAQRFGINSIPASYLLDKEGKVVAQNLRGEALLFKLESLFK